MEAGYTLLWIILKITLTNNTTKIRIRKFLIRSVIVGYMAMEPGSLTNRQQICWTDSEESVEKYYRTTTRKQNAVTDKTGNICNV